MKSRKEKAEKLVETLLKEAPDREVNPEVDAYNASDRTIDSGDDEIDPDNEYVIGADEQMAQILIKALSKQGYRCVTFDEAGLRTGYMGIVAKGELGKFQIEIADY
jgi:hypothetical protein